MLIFTFQIFNFSFVIMILKRFTKTFDCDSSLNTKLDTILKWANKAGKSVGIVSTTRITHASPAANFANVAFRNWETFDGKKFTDEHQNKGCKDIAAQLIDDNNFINVIFGGGRKMFLTNDSIDYYESQKKGLRIDGRNLISEWEDKMLSMNKTYKFIWNYTDFRRTDYKRYDHILGLMAYDHMSFEVFRDPLKEPSLEEMTEKAIELLSQNEKGYFLFVEGKILINIKYAKI